MRSVLLGSLLAPKFPYREILCPDVCLTLSANFMRQYSNCSIFHYYKLFLENLILLKAFSGL